MCRFALAIACCVATVSGCGGSNPQAAPEPDETTGAGGEDQTTGTGGRAASGSGGSRAGAGGALGAGGAGGTANPGKGGSGGVDVTPDAGAGGAQGGNSATGGGSGGGTSGGGAGGGAAGSSGVGGPGCAPGVAFCDDFEGYTAGSPPMGKWQPVGKGSGGFSVVIDDKHAFSGTKAYHVSVDYKGGAYSEIYMGAKTGITGDTGYARFMMYQTSWERPHPDTVPGIHARLLVIGNVAVDLDFSPTVWALEFNADGFGPMAHMGPKPILNRWICVKVQLGPKLALTVDNMPLSVANGGGKGFESLKLGISTYRTFSTDFWVDDLIVDSKPVECPKQ